MKGVGLSQEMLKKMSDKAQDHAIRLHNFVAEVKELAFWHRLFNTETNKERVEALGTCLREISQHLEHVELDHRLKNLWDYALQVYEKAGGK